MIYGQYIGEELNQPKKYRTRISSMLHTCFQKPMIQEESHTMIQMTVYERKGA